MWAQLVKDQVSKLPHVSVRLLCVIDLTLVSLALIMGKHKNILTEIFVWVLGMENN